MIPDLTRLAKYVSLAPEELRRRFEEHAGTLARSEYLLLEAVVELAETTANLGAPAPELVSVLVDLARREAARAPRNTISANQRRVLSARTLHQLRELGLYRDADGVEPVWPHAGMLILNPVLGCSFGCAYCFRADEQRSSVDWFLNGRPTQVIGDSEVVDRLSRHPFFVPGVTQLGLHTASTEPFLPQVRASTFRLLELLEERGWRNDVMIITKHFITAADVARLASFQSFQILLFLTFNAAPAEMEPMGARHGFHERQVATVHHLKAHPNLMAAHYYRPIVPGWNDGEEQIAQALTFGEPLGLTVIGGLKEIPGLDEISLRRRLSAPTVAQGEPGEKHFPPELVERIFAIHGRLGLSSTVVGDQSCGLTVMLSRLRGAAVPNVEAVRMYDAMSSHRPKCLGRCSPAQLDACARPPVPSAAAVTDLLGRMDYDGSFEITERAVVLRSPVTPTDVELAFLSAHLRYAVLWRP
jgi:hypothetical protein